MPGKTRSQKEKNTTAMGGKKKTASGVVAKARSTSKSSARNSVRPAPARTKGKPTAKVELISSKRVYRGPLFDVYTDQVREPEGVISRRDVIRHSGSVVILAVDTSQNESDPRIVIERQYRHAAGQYMWEIPAGRKEPEEGELAGAKRELLEETGYRARRWTKLLRIYVSPGFLSEWMQLYLAEDLTSGDSEPDEDEYIEHRMIPLSEALRWIESGKIFDGKSIVAILHYHLLRSGQMRLRNSAARS